MENLYLIVGLGNPGADYTRTRHNVGFLVVERLAQQWRAPWTSEKKFQARLARGELGERRVLLCEPQTFMNASGEAVGAVTAFYQVAIRHLLVVVDDADLPLGHVRLRPAGGTGGHHGLESIEQRLGSRQYARLRLGIGRREGEGARELTGHVLGKFGVAERPLLDKVITVACGQLETWLTAGIQKAMSQFNGIVDDPVCEGKEQ